MVYDCFTYCGEEDILEIRLNMLSKHVDYFIISEARETFSGQPKPLYFQYSERFDKWRHKIFYQVLDKLEGNNAFERAAFQKDSIRNILKVECRIDDTVYYGDVDEIWTPQTEEGKLKQLNYSYFLNMRSSEEWQGTNVFKYKNIRNLNDIRADHSVVLEDGGWHFTNMGGVEQVRKKLESYDHQEFNTDEVKDDLEWKMEHGEDYVGRSHDWQGKPFTMWVDESQLPEYVLKNKEKYGKLFKNS